MDPGLDAETAAQILAAKRASLAEAAAATAVEATANRLGQLVVGQKALIYPDFMKKLLDFLATGILKIEDIIALNLDVVSNEARRTGYALNTLQMSSAFCVAVRPDSLRLLLTRALATRDKIIPSEEWLREWFLNNSGVRPAIPIEDKVQEVRSSKRSAFRTCDPLIQHVDDFYRVLMLGPEAFACYYALALVPESLAGSLRVEYTNNVGTPWNSWAKLRDVLHSRRGDFEGASRGGVNVGASTSAGAAPPPARPVASRPPAPKSSGKSRPRDSDSGPSGKRAKTAPFNPASVTDKCMVPPTDAKDGEYGLFVEGLLFRDRQELMKHNQCLLCKKVGHFAADCRDKAALFKAKKYYYYKK